MVRELPDLGQQERGEVVQDAPRLLNIKLVWPLWETVADHSSLTLEPTTRQTVGDQLIDIMAYARAEYAVVM